MEKEAIEFFEKFVSKYNLEENKGNLNSYFYKYQHTYDVLKWMNLITVNMDLSKRELEQTKTVAIFHDLGRFVQLEKAKYYNDLKTKLDHATESVNILINENWFSKVTLQEKENISFACQHHNKISIPEEKSFKYHLALLLRDADKLAILERLPLNKCQQKLSKCVKEAFLKKNLIDCHLIKTDIDETIFHLAYIFDINYLQTFDLLKKYKLLDRWLEHLNNNMENEEYKLIAECTHSLFKIPN